MGIKRLLRRASLIDRLSPRPCNERRSQNAPKHRRLRIEQCEDRRLLSVGTAAQAPNFDTTGLYNPATSTFYLKNANTTGVQDITFSYGTANAGWIPIAGDWDGNGIYGLGMYDPVASVFYLRNTTSLQGANDKGFADVIFAFGAPGAGWLPIAGDWDGDGKDTIGLYDPSRSVFFLRNTTSLQGPNDKGSADVTFAFGAAGAGWLPIAGDWDGNGKDTIGLYDTSRSMFLLRNTTSLQGPGDKGFADVVFAYGAPGAGWLPIAGDWDSDGKDTMGLFDTGPDRFLLRNTTSLQGPNDKGFADVVFTFTATSTPTNTLFTPLAGDWNRPNPPLLAAGGSVTAGATVSDLSLAQLRPMVREAIARWRSADVDASTVANFMQVQFVISDLPGSYLAEAGGNRIYIDSNAGGHGWFIDPTPATDEEFALSSTSRQLGASDRQAVDRIDLLTVVEHELGHIAGLHDLDASVNDLMSGVLGVGVRRHASYQDAIDATLAS